MANIFQRINDIISANINDMIDRAEEPEIMLNHFIHEMEDHIRWAKKRVIEAIASEKKLGRELEHHRYQAEDLLKKAEKALGVKNEKLAKAALTRRKEHDKIVQELEPSWELAKNNSKRLKEQLHAMENKLEKARLRRSSLLARKRAAQARKHMNITLSRFEKRLYVQDRFSRMEERILEIETRTEAIEELDNDLSHPEQELEQLIMDSEVENELARLKKNIAALPQS